VKVTLHHLVVHQAIDDVGSFLLGGADDRGMEEEVPLIEEGVGTGALALAEALEIVHLLRQGRLRLDLASYPILVKILQENHESFLKIGIRCACLGSLRNLCRKLGAGWTASA
jgi:hypothetical protein